MQNFRAVYSLSLWVVTFVFACSPCAVAADFRAAEKLRERYRGKLLRDEVRANWSEDCLSFWFQSKTGLQSREYIVVDIARRKRRTAFDHQALADALNAAVKANVSADRLVLKILQMDFKRQFVSFVGYGHSWKWDDNAKQLEKLKQVPVNRYGGRSRGEPLQRAKSRRETTPPTVELQIKDHNVWARPRGEKTWQAITTDGRSDDAYQKRMYWSPAGRTCLILREKAGHKRYVHLVEAAPKDQLQPKHDTYFYLKPGDKLRQLKLSLFDAASMKVTPVDDELFRNQWGLSKFHWSDDSQEFFFLFNQRGHQLLRVIGVNASTGKARVVVEEKQKTFVDYNYKSYLKILPRDRELLWTSERDGWNHLYLYDVAAGAVKQQLTQGEWTIRGIDAVDTKRREVWFRAGGFNPDEDPYHVHYFRVKFDGTQLTRLTRGYGTHRLEFSPDGQWILDTWSRVDLPPVVELRDREDGKLICQVEQADDNLLRSAGWRPPERFIAAGRDGKTPIYGVVWRPTQLAEEQRKYPVIESIYAGPHGAFVPKSFSEWRSQRAIAELGFVVVKIDGMGTSHRSKAFHDVCWKNLGDSGFPDRRLWIEALARQDASIDLTRVGIYGGSAGGQSTLRALLAHGDFYKVGVADCGCHDNRMDKIWWNEQWMGWPVGPHYKEQSNVTQAHKLTGKLLLTVGALDRNVDPSSTMQVVEALIQADKDFDLIVFPSGGHGIGESSYGRRRRAEFFVEHLRPGKVPSQTKD